MTAHPSAQDAPAAGMSMTSARCRFCQAPLEQVVVDLGMSPLCESFLSADQLNDMEAFYPLRVFVCTECYLMQLEAYVSGEAIFTDYAYFSSYSESWLAHAKRFVDAMIQRFDLGTTQHVIEVASNDGYLLQYFVERGVPCLGIEPAANVAAVANANGVPTRVEFFGDTMARRLAKEGTQADLVIGNNVLAQVPDLNDFVEGLRRVLSERGVITLEFPHLVRLIEENQFDTIYHEHYSYFSLATTERIFSAHGLAVFDVEELPTHGGSLRVYGCHATDTSKPPSARLESLRKREEDLGVTTIPYYASFAERVEQTKRRLLAFLIAARDEGRVVVGYGAPGKGNTLLNYCGIRTDLVAYTVDRSPHKQGKYLPGTHIPIHPPERITETKPDYVLILPWNLRDEITAQMTHVREWGGRFVVPIPEVQVLP